MNRNAGKAIASNYIQHAFLKYSTSLTALSAYMLPSYILRTASGRTDGRDVYGVTERPPMTYLLPSASNYIGDSR
jgi:hypothetical protein